MSKPKVAFYWCASCGGCEETVLDLAEAVLDVVKAVDIVFWPVAMDFKESDVQAMEDGSIAVAFINGAICNSQQRHMAELLRRKAQTWWPSEPARNWAASPGWPTSTHHEDLVEAIYGSDAPQEIWKSNGHELTLPRFGDKVQALDHVIAVEYYVPGCPPTAKITQQAIDALLSGSPPPKGAVLAPDKALCEECPRRETRPEKLLIKEFKRPHEIVADQEKCLLAQGLLCLGPETRSGCEAPCIKGNMPCTGCFGPTSRVRDFGAKALSAVASLADSNEESDIERMLAPIADPVGTFYRYGLPTSLAGGKFTK